ncbi:amino acid adenylation domain-containing protein [Nonomuraea salmonea]|uniref:Amino acid adenylation domain-containing protein n=1 Tax=Nonomuraea salmonea TaxID=46181 RepID=A0ABV5P1E9_9ACTN
MAVSVTTLDAVLRATVSRLPDQVAVIGDEHWSYARLDAEATRRALALRASGVRPGDRVAVALKGDAEALAVVAAVARCGASLVPVDLANPPARVAFILADSGCRLIVADSAGALRGPPPGGCPVITTSELAGVAPVTSLSPPEPDAPVASLAPPGPDMEAYVLYTSGSTGRPKGVRVRHSAIADHAIVFAEFLGLTPADRVLQFSSLGFDTALEEIWCTWAAGAALVVKRARVLGPYEVGELVRRSGVSVLSLPTAYWRTLAGELDGVSRAGWEGLRCVSIGGEAASVADLRAHRRGALAGADLVNGYGPTECVVTATARRFGPSDPVDSAAGSLPIGAALPGRVAVALLPDGRTAGPGQEGELLVGGVIADGYVGRDELTARRFVRRRIAGEERTMYRTGDIVRVPADGDGFVFLRRVDDQVKLRGYRIELGEVDAALRELGPVRDAAAALVPREHAEPLLGALVVPRCPEAWQAAEAAGTLAASVPPAMIPAVWVMADKVPLNVNGKIDRVRVAEAIAAGAGGARDARPPSSDDDRPLALLARIWADVLDMPDPSPSDDFLDSGGDSLLAVRLAARARALGLAVSPSMVLQHGSLERIALAATATTSTGTTPQPRPGADPLRTGSTPAATPAGRLMPSQLRWILDGPVPDIHHFVLPNLFRIPAALPDAAVEAAGRAIVAAHGALRSSIDFGAPAIRELPVDAVDPVEIVELPAGPMDAVLPPAAERILSSMDPALGGLFRLVRLRSGERHRLLVAAHHAVVDGWSMALLTDEVETALSTWARTGQARLHPPAASVADYAAHIARYVASDQARHDHAAWLAAPWSELDTLDGVRRDGAGLLPTIVTSHALLPAGDTDAFLRASSRIGRPDALLRACLLVAVAEWTGVPVQAVDVYGNNRVNPPGGLDLTRTIGYIQTTHPEFAVVEGTGVKAVRSVLDGPRYAPPRPYGFDALRFLSPSAEERSALAALPRPVLRLNYRSQMDRLSRRASDAILADADEDTGRHRSPRQRERYLLMFEADVIGDRLDIGVKFSTDQFDRDAIDTLAARAARLLGETVRKGAR